MALNYLFNVPGSRQKRTRVGRGIGSGKGKTCGRGHKGQKSRAGVAIKDSGEQTQLFKMLPKRGFNSNKSIRYSLINLADLEVLASEGKIDTKQEITKTDLVRVGIIKTDTVQVKLLGGLDKLAYKFMVKFDAYSKSAVEVIQKSGGQVL